MLIRKLFRTAWQYRAQFISMVIMIALGVGMFLGFNMEWFTIEHDTGRFFDETGYADFRLYSESGFTKAEAEAVAKVAGVDEVSRYLSVNLDLADDHTKSLALDVTENFNVSAFTVTEGKPYDKYGEGVWLSDKFADANGITLGDGIALNYKGAKIEGEVVGLIKASEHMICVADANQLMPDYTTYGYAYISPEKLTEALGFEFYPQLNVLSDLTKEQLEERASAALGRTVMVTPKEDHVVYKEAEGEADEGRTMGSVLPVLFLAIAVLTMVTTMHRIAAAEKVQIGTLKALGFKNRSILGHYTAYGLTIGLLGSALGVALGYGVCYIIMNPNGMMGTYFDMPYWDIKIPPFCIPLIIGVVALLTLISWLSVREHLKGTAAEALRPYTPKPMRSRLKASGEGGLGSRLSFGTRWNLRDIMRHKNRSAMTLLGVVGCMVLMVGGLGMRDTMAGFLDLLDNKISNYNTKVNLVENADYEAALALCRELEGDWVSQSGVSLEGDTVVLEIYDNSNDLIRVVDEANEPIALSDDGVYLCQRLRDRAEIGQEITFSPYGSNESYTVKVAGYSRSIMTESITMTEKCADRLGIAHTVTSIFTKSQIDEIEASGLIAGKQSQRQLMDTFASFTEIMDTMVLVLVIAAMVLGVVVLYNLGVMSYVERSRELATLKVLGFRSRSIGSLLITQNLWLTVLGVIIGLPAGVGVLKWLVTALAGEYELKLMLGPLTYVVSTLLTFGVSLLVGVMVARKNKHIDMVEALKDAE